MSLRSFLIAASIRNFRLKAERSPEMPEEKRFSYPAIRSESSLRAVRSCAIVEIPEKSFLAIKDIYKKFHENIHKEFLPYKEHHYQEDKEDTTDDECCGRPASDEVAEEEDRTEGERGQDYGTEHQHRHQRQYTADTYRKAVHRLQLEIVNLQFHISADIVLKGFLSGIHVSFPPRPPRGRQVPLESSPSPYLPQQRPSHVSCHVSFPPIREPEARPPRLQPQPLPET